MTCTPLRPKANSRRCAPGTEAAQGSREALTLLGSDAPCHALRDTPHNSTPGAPPKRRPKPYPSARPRRAPHALPPSPTLPLSVNHPAPPHLCSLPSSTIQAPARSYRVPHHVPHTPPPPHLCSLPSSACSTVRGTRNLPLRAPSRSRALSRTAAAAAGPGGRASKAVGPHTKMSSSMPAQRYGIACGEVRAAAECVKVAVLEEGAHDG